MAKVITWYPPFAAPVNFTATAVAGGSLADDTYYFRIYAVNSYTDRTEHQHGIMAAEINATTSGSNNSINLSWDAVAGCHGYVIVKSTTSGSYSGNNMILGVEGDTGVKSYFCTTINTTYTFDGTQSYYNDLHPAHCPIAFPDGLDKENGRGYVTVSGGTEGDPVTPEDINTAIGDTTYSVYDGNSWSFQGSMSANGGYFVAEDLNCWFCGWLYDNVGGNFRFGRETTYTDATYYNHPCKVQCIPDSFMRPFARNGTFRYYATIFSGCESGNPYYEAGSCNSSTLAMSDSGIIFKQSYIFEYVVKWYGNVTIENTIIKAEVSPYYIYPDFTNFKYCTLNQGLRLDDLTSGDPSGTFNYLTLNGYNTGWMHIRVRQTHTTKNYLINCTVPTAASGHEGLPTIYWYSTHTYPATCFIYWQKTFNLKVVDVAGDPIASANVVVKDVDGVEHADSPLTTDANGDTTEIIVTSCILQRNDTVQSNAWGWPYTEQVNKYPYTVTVTKAGKLSKTIKYDITEATSDTMLLENAKDLNFSRKGRLTLQ